MRCGQSLQKRCMPGVGRSKIRPGRPRIREVLGRSVAPVVSLKIWPAAHFFTNFLLNRDASDLKFLVLSTISLVVETIPTPILSDHSGIICTKQ